MQKLLSVYYQCCYKGHWRELNEVLNFKIANPSNEKGLLNKCVKGAHQRRLTSNTVDLAVNALYQARILHKTYIDFEAMYDEIRPLLTNIVGIGDLTVYDTALRIGFVMFPILLPQQYVYLARGAMDGAVKLLNAPNQLKYREPSSRFAPYFGNLSSHFVEDFLCVMKKYLVAGGVNHKIPLPPDASECGCLCAERVRNTHSGKADSVCSKDNCCGFCKRICNDKGEMNEDYIENDNY